MKYVNFPVIPANTEALQPVGATAIGNNDEKYIYSSKRELLLESF